MATHHESFITLPTLDRHYRSHTEEKKQEQPCLCPTCGKSFSSGYRLRVHQRRIHLGFKRKEKMVSCFMCQKTMPTDRLNVHMRIHTGDRPFPCQWCNNNKEFKSIAELNLHIGRVHTKEKPHLCQTCEKGFQTTSSLKDHLCAQSTAVKVKSFKCPNPDCDKVYLGRNSVGVHLRRSPGCKPNPTPNAQEEKFSCPFCPKICSMKADLVKHVGSHTEESKCVCSICSKTFADPFGLRAHIKRVHKQEKPHKCPKCPKTFFTRVEVRKHEVVHESEVFSCHICGKEMKRTSLKQHLYDHKQNALFPCSFCSKTYMRKAGLRRHVRVHAEELLHTCSICSKTFGDSSVLRCHIKRVHKQEKPHKCPKCPKTFCTRAEVRSHEVVHESEMFSCKICGREMKRSSLKTHMYHHHKKNDSFPCPFCPKMFSLKTTLSKHVGTHTQERKCTCSICSKTYSNLMNLQSHIKRVHQGQKSLKCPKCPKTFFSQSDVRGHEAVHESDMFSCHICGREMKRNSLKTHMYHHKKNKEC